MIVHKSAAVVQVGGEYHFTMSDGSVDRLGDVIEPAGWELAQFRAHPIALFNHGKQDPLPIGTWSDVRVEKGQLRGKLNFAAPGTSPRIDEMRSLLEQGILRAASVGFEPIEDEPLQSKSRGRRYKRQRLVECSLVTIPANANALQIAKSLNISDDTLNFVFGEQATEGDGMVRRHIGEHAGTPPGRKPGTMTTLSDRIKDAETELLQARDALAEHIKDEAADVTKGDEIAGTIETKEAELASLKRQEKALGLQVVEKAESNGSGAVTVRGDRLFPVAAKKVTPADYVLRAGVASLISYLSRRTDHPMTHAQVLAERYGEDGRIDDKTKAITDIITRAASAPATTTTSGWALPLVQTINVGFIDLLMPASVYPGLSSRGMRMNFGRAGVINIPARSATPTIAGSFVAEGAPIPVRQGAFTSIPFTPKKMAVISTFTREIYEHSTPAIEGLVRNAIQEDTAVALDSVLLDATAATTTRPAGIRAGVSVTTATAGGGFAALVGDLKALVGALITGSNGNLRQPVWIMNPIQALSISVTQNAGGDFPFAAEVNNNQFSGYPIVLSSTVTAGMVLLVDAADFVAIEGATPRFDVSDQATLHMEDTTPLAIGTAGSPATVAAPVRSLYQTDSLALRMIMDINWGFRRTGTVSWTQAVTW